MNLFKSLVFVAFLISNSVFASDMPSLQSLAKEASRRTPEAIDDLHFRINKLSANPGGLSARESATINALKAASKLKAGKMVCIDGLGCFRVDHVFRRYVDHKINAITSDAKSRTEREVASLSREAKQLESGEKAFVPGLFEARDTLVDGDWGKFDRSVEMQFFLSGGMNCSVGRSRQMVLFLGWSDDDFIEEQRPVPIQQPSGRRYGRLPGVGYAREADGMVVVTKISGDSEFEELVKKARLK